VRAPYLGITGKFILLATGLVVLSTSIWGIWVWQREKALLETRLRQEGRILLSTMAIPFINALLYEEIGIIEEGGLLDSFIADIMAQTDIAPVYAMVLDPEGRVLAHNQFSEYRKVYADELSQKAIRAQGYTVLETRTDGGPTWDLSYPLAIHGKRWGVLRVGISLTPLQAELMRLGKEVVLFSGGFTLAALAVFVFIGRGLAQPLLRLTKRMESVGAELPDPPAVSPRRDEIGDLERSFTAMVERLRKSEAESQAAVKHLLESERLVAIGQIVAGVAHEVNNPLAAIDAALFNLQNAQPHEHVLYIRVVRDGIERISRVVSQLLDLSRSGELDLAEVELAAFCRDAGLFAKMALKQRGVRLSESSGACRALVAMDRSKIQQVLLNLFVNAADAAGENGTVEFSCRQDEREVHFEVVDDGPGVPKELSDRIFEPFFTTKPAGQGSGMGLAVSRRIAEAHQGRLELGESTRGTRFVLSLPVAPESLSENPEPTAKAAETVQIRASSR
jgi:signal transduction histidine kinase